MRDDADAYHGWLRAQYKTNPRPFVDLARRARDEDVTLLASAHPHLLPVWFAAIVGVAARKGWRIAGVDVAMELDSQRFNGAGTEQ